MIRDLSQQTAIKAIDILVKKDLNFFEPTKKQRMNLAAVYARKNMILYGRAFDVVKAKKKIDFDSEEDILKNIDSIVIYEIKSTNRKDMRKDFKNYFFDLTTAELLVAQSLKEKFKFIFVNTVTKDFMELSVEQVFGKAVKIYPKWAIRF